MGYGVLLRCVVLSSLDMELGTNSDAVDDVPKPQDLTVLLFRRQECCIPEYRDQEACLHLPHTPCRTGTRPRPAIHQHYPEIAIRPKPSSPSSRPQDHVRNPSPRH